MKGNLWLGVVASGLILGCDTGKDRRELISGSEMRGATSGQAAGQDANGKPDLSTLPTPPNPPPTPSSQTPQGGSGQQGGVSSPSVPTPSAPSPTSSAPPPSNGGGSQTSGGGSQTPQNPLPQNPTPQTPPQAVSLEECARQKRAWPAVVNQKQPTQCGDQLVDWCCTQAEIKARFPTLAQTLEEKFKKQGDVDQFVLYQCSFDLTGSPQKGIKYTFHFAKIVEPQVFYQPIHVYNLAAVTPAQPQNPCPSPVKVQDLKTAPQLPAPEFGTVIKPILDAKCGGTACHSAATTLTPALNFEVAANLKKANRAFLFSMPPAGSGKSPLTGAEVKALTDFMAAP